MLNAASRFLLIRYQVRRSLGASLILQINPQSVLRFAGSNQPMTLQIRHRITAWEEAFPASTPALRFFQKCLYSIEPFCLLDNAFSQGIAIEDEERYLLIQDFISNRANIAASRWYKHLVNMLLTKGFASHKAIRMHSEDDIAKFLQSYVGGMVESLENTGYDSSRASDVGTAFVDADGSIHKCDAGNHRFSAARILGVAPVPVEILGVHRDWYQSQVGHGGTAALKHALARVEAAHQGGRG